MTIKISIEGITPLICHRFTDEAAEKSTNGSRSVSSVADRGSPREQAEKFLYKSLDGKKFVIPQPNLFSCIVGGGLFHKNGRSKITTQKTSMIYACLEIHASEVPIVHKEPWEVDTRPVVIPSTGGRILAHRPKFNDWSLEFEAELDREFMSPKLFRAIVDDAGKRIGLGGFRPAVKGPFGKFVVTKWQE